MSSAATPPRVALFTAYTSDYRVGELCARVNRAYAQRHGYGWVCHVGAPRSRCAARHPTWDKVELLLELMGGLLEGGSPRGLSPRTTHLMWVDADAVVLRHDRTAEQILASLPRGMELVVGEDLTPACVLNAGVWIAKVSAWSLALWHDVWASEASVRFWLTPFHEQSCLLHQLGLRKQGLRLLPVFHSFCGGPGLKLFHSVAVLPRAAFNTNRGDTRLPTTSVDSGSGMDIKDAANARLAGAYHLDLSNTPSADDSATSWLPWSARALPRPPLRMNISIYERGDRSAGAVTPNTYSGSYAWYRPSSSGDAFRPGGDACCAPCASRTPAVHLECNACLSAVARCEYIFHAAGRPTVLTPADPRGVRGGRHADGLTRKKEALVAMLRHAGHGALVLGKEGEAPPTESLAGGGGGGGSALAIEGGLTAGPGMGRSLQLLEALVRGVREGGVR